MSALELAERILSNDTKQQNSVKLYSQLIELAKRDSMLLGNQHVVAALCTNPFLDRNSLLHNNTCVAAWSFYAKQPNDAALGRVCELDETGRFASLAIRREVFEIWLAQRRFDLLAKVRWAVVRKNASRVLDACLAFCEQDAPNATVHARAWDLVQQNIELLTTKEALIRLRGLAVDRENGGALQALLAALGGSTTQAKVDFLFEHAAFREHPKVHFMLADVLRLEYKSYEFENLASMADHLRIMQHVREAQPCVVGVA